MNPNNKFLEELKVDIDKARTWARKHFNADAESDTFLDPPTFWVEFPEPDEMRISPRMYGHLDIIWAEYKLTWNSNGLAWEAKHFLTRRPSGHLLWVKDEENA